MELSVYAHLASSVGLYKFSGKEKYITLAEKAEAEGSIQKCIALDQGLNIIDKVDGKMVDFNQNVEEEQTTEKDQILFEITNPATKYTYEKQYKKYPQLHDFKIGRVNWGRKPRTIKLNSDTISRDHTFLKYHSSNKQKKNYLSAMQEGIKLHTRISSKWRKISIQILEKIVEYIVSYNYYSIQDQDSRNGTFLIDFSEPVKELRENHCYQFQNQAYYLKVKKISTLTATEFKTELERYYQHLEQISASFLHQTSVILPDNLTLPTLQQYHGILHTIQLEIYIKFQLKMVYWVATSTPNKKYPIGQGQTINISYRQQQYNSRRHGSLQFFNNKWQLVPKQNRHIWSKLQPRQEHILTQPRYRLMVAHYTTFDLEFHNF